MTCTRRACLVLSACLLAACGESKPDPEESERVWIRPEERYLSRATEDWPSAPPTIELTVDESFRHTGPIWFHTYDYSLDTYPTTTVGLAENVQNGLAFIHTDGFSVHSLVLELDADTVRLSGSQAYDTRTIDPDTGESVPDRSTYRLTGGSVRTNTRDWTLGSEIHVEFKVMLLVGEAPEIIRGSGIVSKDGVAEPPKQRAGILSRHSTRTETDRSP